MIFKKQYPIYKGFAFENLVYDAVLEFKFVTKSPMEYVGKFVQRNVEIDLIIKSGTKLYAIEIKYGPNNFKQLRVKEFVKKLEYLKAQLTKHNLGDLKIVPGYVTLFDLHENLKKQVGSVLPDVRFWNVSEVLKGQL